MMANVLIANKVHNAVNDVITALMARRDRSVRERALIIEASSQLPCYTAIPTPAVLRVTLQTSTRAMALTTKVTRKRIKPSSTSELR